MTSRKLDTILLPLSFISPPFSSSAEISIRAVTRMRNERPFISSTSPIRARIERGARESIRRKPQIVNILERARTKLAAGKCGAPKLWLCARRALHSSAHISSLTRSFPLAACDFFFFFSLFAYTSALLFILPHFVLFSFALCFCASYLRNCLNLRPSLLTRRFSFPSFPCVYLSFYLHLFLCVIYSRTCQRINIFMTTLQHSLTGLPAFDMHVYSCALLFHAHLLSDLPSSPYLSTRAIPLIFSLFISHLCSRAY